LIIYDESANPLKRKFIAGLQGKVLAFFGGKAVYCSFRYRKTYSFDEAILFFSRCSANYFHWMIEYLPRLKIIADLKKTDIPALVPKRLAPQQLEAIKYLAGELNLKLVYVENESRILVKRLHIPMPLTFHPDDPDVPFWIGAGLPAEHIKFFRDSLLKAMKLPSQAKKTRKLFLARRGAFRNITNIKSIEAVVAEEGFEIFYPETSSLKEQAEILMQAQVIVAPCGSALTNIIFMSPGAKVISLIGQHNASYSMYANLAGVVGVEYLHVTGVSQHPREYYSTDLAYIHASFSVSPEKLRRAIQSLSTQ
jgi:capsular polysaccharide biosynthesis protein